MQSPTVGNNNYFIGANANKKFEEYLHQKIQANRRTYTNSEIKWWSPHNPNTQLHCTLAQGFSDQNLLNPQPNKATLVNSIQKVMQKVPSSLHFKVDKAEVTTSAAGWIILKLKSKNKLQNIHNEFTQNFTNEHIKLAKFSNQSYNAHISIGQLPPNADPVQAQKELDTLVKAMEKDPFPFVMYDVEMKNASNQLVKNQFSRKDVGIVRVSQLANSKVEVELGNPVDANRLKKKLKKYYNISTEVKIQNGSKFTLEITKSEFNKVEGHYKGLVLQNSMQQSSVPSAPISTSTKYHGSTTSTTPTYNPYIGSTTSTTSTYKPYTFPSAPSSTFTTANSSSSTTSTASQTQDYGVIGVQPQGQDFLIQVNSMQNAQALANDLFIRYGISSKLDSSQPKKIGISNFMPQLWLTAQEFGFVQGSIKGINYPHPQAPVSIPIVPTHSTTSTTTTTSTTSTTNTTSQQSKKSKKPTNLGITRIVKGKKSGKSHKKYVKISFKDHSSANKFKDKLTKLEIKKCSVKPSKKHKGEYSIIVSEKKFTNKIQKKYSHLFIKP